MVNLNRHRVVSLTEFYNYQSNSYKFTNIDANLEYYKQYKNLSFRPGISIKHNVYNSPITYDEPYSMTHLNYQFKDEPRTFNFIAASMLSEWKPVTNLRIIGAARLDKFSINNNFSLNYEVAATYRINKNNLIRFVYSKANQSPFIFNKYLNANFNLSMQYVSEYDQPPLTVPIKLNIFASKDLEFPAIQNHEIGWRTKICPNSSLDIEFFYSNYENFIVSNVYRAAEISYHVDENGLEDHINSIKSTADFVFGNDDLKAQQFGTSFTLNLNFSNKIDAKIFGTYQKTFISGDTETEFTITKLDIGNLGPDNNRVSQLYSFTNPTQWSEKLTPSFFGGYYLNYKCTDKLNFNTDAYFTSRQKFIDFDSNNTMADYIGQYTNYSMDVNANLVLNAKVSYRLFQNITVYGNIKNILGSHREYGYADQIGTLYLIGIKWEP